MDMSTWSIDVCTQEAERLTRVDLVEALDLTEPDAATRVCVTNMGVWVVAVM